MTDARICTWVALLLVTLATACGRGVPQSAAPYPVGTSDALLLRDQHALYRAAQEHSVPGQPGYDVERAIGLFEEFIARYPGARERAAASDRLALLHEIRALRLQLQALKDIDLRRRP